MRVLAAAAGLELELRDPGIVGQHPRDFVDHVHRARISVLLGQNVVVVVLHPFELLTHLVRRLGLHSSLGVQRRKLDRVVPLLEQRHEHGREGEGPDQRERYPHLRAPPLERARARRVRQQVEPRRGRRRRARHDRDDHRAPVLGLSFRAVDDRLQRRDPVDPQHLFRRVACNHGSVEIKLLGTKRGVTVEIVGQRLNQIFLDRGR